MFRLLKRFRRVVQFLLVFIGSYILLSFLYQCYLQLYFVQDRPDFITRTVALQTEGLLKVLGYDSVVLASPVFPLMNLYINGLQVARIIEGCNSVSLIILFVAFMLSFFGKPKSTVLYTLGGVVLIYLINIGRLVLLSVGIYEYPQYSELLHKIIFPLIIYATVLLLWLLWIRRYTKKNVQ